jgi:methionyl-tRNA formyltransferase
VFFGTPRFAVPTLSALLDSHHEVAGVVTQPDRPRGRGQRVTAAPVKALALERGLPVVQPATLRDGAITGDLQAWRPDVGVVAAYGQMIPNALLAVPRFGMINVHPSLLPKYRGAAPVHRAIIAGETETGVTIMRVAAKLDSGAMFARTTHPIGPDQTSEELEDVLAAVGARLLVEVVDSLAAGTAHEEPQDERLATYAPRLTKALQFLPTASCQTTFIFSWRDRQRIRIAADSSRERSSSRRFISRKCLVSDCGSGTDLKGRYAATNRH